MKPTYAPNEGACRAANAGQFAPSALPRYPVDGGANFGGGVLESGTERPPMPMPSTSKPCHILARFGTGDGLLASVPGPSRGGLLELGRYLRPDPSSARAIGLFASLTT
jgi:hypothetical protein